MILGDPLSEQLSGNAVFILMFRPCLLMRSVALAFLFGTAGGLAACSDTGQPPSSSVPAPPVSTQKAADPVGSTLAQTPQTISPGSAQSAAPLPPLTADEKLGGGVSIDRHANAILRDEAGVASHLPAALSPAPAEDALSGTQARLESLEKSVSDLRTEFDSLLPAIRELIEAGKSDRISVASGTPSIPPKAVSAPTKPSSSLPKTGASEPKKLPTTKTPDETPTSSPEATVTGVRIGIHPDRTRIVLDLSQAAAFKTDLDNTEKLLLVDLAGAAWSAPETQSAPGKSLVGSWSTQTAREGKGTTAIFQLSGPVKILSASSLRPEGKSGHRIVIDLGPDGK